ncbi:MAG: response regulator [Elusimicrobiota bacterium]|nr:response regulator [Elusimicrobiota bacterium]
MSGPTKTILIVDDNPNFSFVWKEFCESEGHRVLTADDADQALRLVESEPRIDLVMTDLVMPRTSGYELIQRLRAISETRATPILLLTASGKVVHDLAEKEGARCLSKSLETGILLRRIREALYPGGAPAPVAPAPQPLPSNAPADGPAAWDAVPPPEPAEEIPLYQIIHTRYDDFVPRNHVMKPWVPPAPPSRDS